MTWSAVLLLAQLAAPSTLPPREEAPGLAVSQAALPSGYARLPPRSCGAVMEPRLAIERAADVAPAGVAACFLVTVRRVGDDGRGNLFLDSEDDYRDQRSLNIRVAPSVVPALRVLLGTADIAGALVGRTLLVDGAAFRTRIDFTYDGRPTGKYYYQTQVPVGDVGQLARPSPF